MRLILLLAALVSYADAQCSVGYYYASGNAGPNPYAYYTWDENNRLQDKAGGIGPLTITAGTPTYLTDCQWTGAECPSGFGSSFDYTIPSFVIPTQFSVCLWVYATALGSYGEPFHFASSDESKYMKLTLTTSRYFSLYTNYGSGVKTTGSSTQRNLNQWYHVCATINPTTISLYVDGNFDASYSATAVSISTSSLKNRLGAPSVWFGHIDEVRIYLSTLTASEVSAVYNYLGPVCTICTANFFCVNSIQTACFANSVSNTGASVCTCNAGYFNNGTACNICSSCSLFAVTNSTCSGLKDTVCTCNAGYYGNGITCTICSAGFYCTNSVQAVCTANTYSASGASVCSPCAANMYAAAGSANCTCSAGYKSKTTTNSIYVVDRGTNIKLYNQNTQACSSLAYSSGVVSGVSQVGASVDGSNLFTCYSTSVYNYAINTETPSTDNNCVSTCAKILQGKFSSSFFYSDYSKIYRRDAASACLLASWIPVSFDYTSDNFNNFVITQNESIAYVWVFDGIYKNYLNAGPAPVTPYRVLVAGGGSTTTSATEVAGSTLNCGSIRNALALSPDETYIYFANGYTGATSYITRVNVVTGYWKTIKNVGTVGPFGLLVQNNVIFYTGTATNLLYYYDLSVADANPITSTNTQTISCISAAQIKGLAEVYDMSQCAICAAGSYCTNGVQTLCSANAGSVAGSSSCVCNAGYYGNGVTCTVCSAGTYAVSNSTVCSTCSANTYSASGASTCTACAANAMSASGASSCVCNSGYYGDGITCTTCSAGTYSASNSTLCTLCAVNKYSAAGSGSCTQCPMGWEATGTGATACTLCVAQNSQCQVPTLTYAYYSKGGSTTLEATADNQGYGIDTHSSYAGVSISYSVKPGYYAGKVTIWTLWWNYQVGPLPTRTYEVSVVCPPRSYCNGFGAFLPCLAGYVPSTSRSSCVACALGTYQSNDICVGCAAPTVCTTGVGMYDPANCTLACVAGQYVVNGTCNNCLAGSYANQTCMSTCTNCKAGTFASGSGESVCTTCAAGTYAASNSSTSCTPCSTNTYSSSGASTCSPCAANSHSASGATGCTCNSGYYGNGISCTVCAAGSFCVGGTQVPCSPNSGSAAGASACTCNGGYYGDGVTCTVCDAGTYAAANSASCTPCAANAHSAAGSTSCTCDSGYIGNGMVCTACTAGTFASGSTCANCSQGFYSGDVAAVCTLCAEALYNSESGSSTCSDCPASSWCSAGTRNLCPLHSVSPALSTSQHACLCLPGYFGSGAIGGTSPCALCWIGSWCPGGNLNTSNACPALMTSPAGASDASQCVCMDGYELVNDVCVCKPNHFCSGSSTSLCPANSSSPAGSASVDACICNAGFYGIAATGCVSCPVGSYCLGDGTSIGCTAHAVTASVRSISPDECFCDRGYVGVNNSACLPCPADSWCWTGIANQCPANTVVAPLASYMVNCTCMANYYGPNGGPCLACAANAHSAVGAASCSCNAGYYGDGVTCTVCGAGTYAVANSATCTPCAANTYSAAASSTCTACAANANSAAGTSSCVCNAGYYGDGVTCIVCGAGTYAVANSASCSQCSVNTYSGAASSTCTACAVNAHSASGAASCSCNTGYYGDGVTCTVCMAGTYSASNSTSCSVCPANTYSAAAASTCTACKANSSAPAGSVDSSQCVCNTGFYTATQQLYSIPTPLAYYSFDTSNRLADKGSLGSLSGTATYNTNCQWTGAECAVTSSGYLTMPAISLPSSFSVCVWWLISNTAGQHSVFHISNGGSFDAIRLSVYDGIGYAALNSPTGWVVVYLATNPVANTWYHTCLVYDFGTKFAQVYEDGVPKNKETALNLKTSYSSNYLGGDWQWNGKFDEFRLFNVALTDAQVSTLRNLTSNVVSMFTAIDSCNTCKTCSANAVTTQLCNNTFSFDSTGCVCNAGYYGDGVTCTACPANTYSAAGASTCTGCAVNTNSAPGATSCVCNSGYYGNGVTCSACRNNSMSDVGSQTENACICKQGFYNIMQTRSLSVASSNLVMYYTFSTSAELKDFTGQRADLTKTGGVSYIVDGPWSNSQAISLDGSTAYMQTTTPNFNTMIQANGSTICLWFMFTSTASSSAIFSVYDGASQQELTISRSGTSNDIDIYTAYGSGTHTTVTADLKLNVWKHICVIVKNINLYVYLDGALNKSFTISGSFSQPMNSFFIGKSFWGQFFAGKIDDVRMYNTMLTASDIQTIYNYRGTAECTACSQCSSSATILQQCSNTSFIDTQCACNAGYYGNGLTCTACAAGKYAVSNSASCTPCAANTYSASGASTCTACAANTNSASGAASCVCNAGYGGDGVTCTMCGAGTYAVANSTVCTLCPANTYVSTTGASTCTSCVANSTAAQGSSSSTQCICNAGSYKKTMFSYSYTGSNQTVDIPAGTQYIEAYVWGGGGGGGGWNTYTGPIIVYSRAGGGGAFARATINVTNMAKLSIFVGGGGTTTNGARAFPAGGPCNIATARWSWPGGGGRSEIRFYNSNGTDGTDTYGKFDSVIVAGAGGSAGGNADGYSAAGYYYGGPGGGPNGLDGWGATASVSANGATTTSGGSGGVASGSKYSGASGAAGDNTGSGGDGYYGGGSGTGLSWAAGGGGGGSSYINPKYATNAFYAAGQYGGACGISPTIQPPAGTGLGGAYGVNGATKDIMYKGGDGYIVLNFVGIVANCAPCIACSPNAMTTQQCNSTANVDTTQCACNAGYYGNGFTCTACAAGTYSASNAASCTPCSNNTYSAAGASTCTACAANTNSASGASGCVCNAGYYGDGVTCTACDTGTYSNMPNSSKCTFCVPNSNTSGSGATLESSCVCNTDYYGSGRRPSDVQSLGMIAYYTFDSSARLADTSSVTGDLIAPASPSYQYNGSWTGSECAVFDGTKNYQVSQSITSFSTAFSVCFWAYYDDLTCCYANRLIRFVEPGGAYMGITYWTNSPYYYSFLYSGGGGYDWFGQVIVKQWHHVCITYGGGVMRYYFNGGLLPATRAYTLLLNKQWTMHIGNNEWVGKLDEVKVYTTALTTAQVSSIYAIRAMLSGGCSRCKTCNVNAILSVPCNSSSINETTKCLCNIGYSGDGFTCNLCPLGFFATAVGQTACTGCALGSYMDPNTNTSCLNCSAGTYTNAVGLTSCSVAPVNTYSSTGILQYCHSNASTATTGSTSAAACLCNANYYGNGLTCTACDAWSSSSPGSTSYSDCLCVPGYYLNNNAERLYFGNQGVSVNYYNLESKTCGRVPGTTLAASATILAVTASNDSKRLYVAQSSSIYEIDVLTGAYSVYAKSCLSIWMSPMNNLYCSGNPITRKRAIDPWTTFTAVSSTSSPPMGWYAFAVSKNESLAYGSYISGGYMWLFRCTINVASPACVSMLTGGSLPTYTDAPFSSLTLYSGLYTFSLSVDDTILYCYQTQTSTIVMLNLVTQKGRYLKATETSTAPQAGMTVSSQSVLYYSNVNQKRIGIFDLKLNDPSPTTANTNYYDYCEKALGTGVFGMTTAIWPQCVACKICHTNATLSGTCSGPADNSICTCNTGFYGDGLTCSPCTVCSANGIASVPCAGTQNAVCLCNMGYYGNGTICTACAENASSQAGSTSASQCVCDTGFYESFISIKSYSNSLDTILYYSEYGSKIRYYNLDRKECGVVSGNNAAFANRNFQYGYVISNDGKKLYNSDWGSSSIYELNLESPGTYQTYTLSFNIVSLWISPLGNFYYLSSGTGGTVRRKLVSEVWSIATVMSLGTTRSTYSFVVNLNETIAYVCDFNIGSYQQIFKMVLSTNAASRSMTLLSGSTKNGQTQHFNEVEGTDFDIAHQVGTLSLSEDEQFLYLTPAYGGAATFIIRINTVNGRTKNIKAIGSVRSYSSLLFNNVIYYVGWDSKTLGYYNITADDPSPSTVNTNIISGCNGANSLVGIAMNKHIVSVNSAICAQCKQCSPFATQSASCPANSSTDVSICTCNSGYYGTGTTCSSCKVCDPHATLSGLCSSTTDASSCQCNSGYYGDGLSCTLCPANSYCINGTQTPCSPNGNAAPGSSQCTCNAGYYGDGITCTVCPVNHQCTNGSSASCPLHASAPLGSPECVCDAGYYGTTSCSLCNIGSYCIDGVQITCPIFQTSDPGASSCMCMAGYINISGNCVNCPAGMYSLAGSGCSNCSQGFYSPGGGSSSCTVCDPGYYNDAPGQSNCTACPPNSWCSAGTRNLCPNHASSPPVSSSQHMCLCDVGYFGDGSIQGTSPCAQCWANHWCPGGNNNVSVACPPHSHSPPESSSSEQCVCNDGFVQEGLLCVCAPNHFCPADTSQLCPANSTSPENSTSIDECTCVAGFHGRAADGCLECKTGFYCPGDGTSIACTAHAVTASERSIEPSDCFCDRGYMGLNNSECLPCPESSWCWTGVRNVCPDNTYAPLYSNYMENCTCVPGYWGPDGGPCYNCPPNHYCEGHESKVACPDLMLAPELSSQRSHCQCKSGYTEVDGVCLCDAGTRMLNDSSCVVCEADSYCDLNVQTMCQSHSVAPVRSVSIEACVCVAGYEMLNGTCTACSAGFFSNTTNSVCEACSVGTYQANLASTVCYDCPLDHYCDSQDHKTACPALMVAPTKTTHLSDCTCISGYEKVDGVCLCLPGTRPLTDTTCIECEANSYCNLNIQTTCQSNSVAPMHSVSIEACVCVPGYEMLNGTCTPCGAGSFSDAIDSMCKACPLGSYQPLSASTACITCDVGSYSSDTGRSAPCELCPADTWSAEPTVACASCFEHAHADPGSVSIDSCYCAASYYLSEHSCHACKTCSADATLVQACPSNSTSDTSACQCNMGYSGDGLWCSICPHNWWGNGTMCSKCTVCPTHADTSGQCLSGSTADPVTCMCHDGYYGSACDLCLPDAWCIGGVLTECTPHASAPEGSFLVSNCTCDEGYYRENETCVACEPGHQCSDEVKTQCAPGTYQPDGVQPACLLAPLGTYVDTSAATSFIICPMGHQTNRTYNGIITTVYTTRSTRSTSIFDCDCGDLAVQFDGSCAPYCDPGQYYDRGCIICPQGSMCLWNQLIRCPSQFSSLPGSSQCATCVGPDTHSNLSLMTCGLKSCVPTPRVQITESIQAVGRIAFSETILFELAPAEDRPIATVWLRVNATLDYNIVQVWVRGNADFDIGKNTEIIYSGSINSTSFIELQFVFGSDVRELWFRASSLITAGSIEMTRPRVVGVQQWEPLDGIMLGNETIVLTKDIETVATLEVDEQYDLVMWSNSTPTIYYTRFGLWTPMVDQTFTAMDPQTKLRIAAGVEISAPKLQYTQRPCKQCLANQYCSNDVATQCRLHSHSSPGSTMCICDNGYFGDECNICLTNHFCVYGFMGMCALGTKAAPGSSRCSRCATNEYCKDGNVNSCLPNAKPFGWPLYSVFNCTCNPGFSGNQCQQCSPGYWCAGGPTAVPCPNGTKLSVARATSIQQCVLCSQGQWSETGASACSDCAPGTYSHIPGLRSQLECLECETGYVCEGGNHHAACKAGSWSNDYGLYSQSQCNACPMGSYCTGGTSVQLCPLGSYSPLYNVTSEFNCPECAGGSYCPNPLLQIECPPNTMAPPGSHDLVACMCMPGYKCTYENVVHAEVVLPVSIEGFAAIEEEYKAAVAAAAGVSIDQVKIISVTTAGNSRRRRRLLNDATAAYAEVHTSIYRAQRSVLAVMRQLPKFARNLHVVSTKVEFHREVVASVRL